MKTITSLLALAFLASPVTAGNLRVVSWNTAGEARDGTGIVLEAIGLESVNGIARPVDVLSLREQDVGGCAEA